MDSHMNSEVNKSSWWWYLLLGLIVFIVILLIVDKNKRKDTLSDKQNQVIEALRAEYAGSIEASPEDQAKVLTEIRKDTGGSKVTPQEQNQILDQIRGGVN